MFFPKDSKYMQYIACLTGSMSVAINGMLSAWPSPAMPILCSKDSPIGRPITVEEGSWIVALFQVAPVLLTYHSNWLLEKYGRKFSLLFSAIPMLISWIMIIFAESVVWLYLARFIAGASTAFINSTVAIYIGEVADKDIRGKLGSTFNLMKLSGSILLRCIAPFVSYTTLGWICAAMPIIFFLSFFKMPESPYFLIKIGKRDKARENLIKLSAENVLPTAIDKKMLEIEEVIDSDMQNKLSWGALLDKEYRMPLMIIFGIKTLQQFSGLTAIDSYMQTIMDASNTGITSDMSSIIYGIIQVPAVILAALTVDKLGRKPIFIISCVGSALALVAEGLYFYMKDHYHKDVHTISWLPVTALVLYALLNNYGLWTVPYILMGELFTTNIKELACTITISYSCFLAFLVSKFYEPISVELGRYTMFWVFAACCLVGAFFVHFFLPETKGKTFNEIQEKLRKKSRHTP